MPSYRSISISLISQFDVKAIPEFQDPVEAESRGIASLTTPAEEAKSPSIAVYVPVHRGSQFWIQYDIASPIPRSQYFFFKLYIDGRSITSWGVGEQDQWKGNAMFTLENVPISTKCGYWQRKNFIFGKDNSESLIELKVFRAKGRKRTIPPGQTEVLSRADGFFYNRGSDPRENLCSSSSGSLIQSDLSLKETLGPVDFYKYALIDSLDTPFATFRYITKDWKGLEEMGMILESFHLSGFLDDRPYSISLGSFSEDSSVLSNIEECPSENALASRYELNQKAEGSVASSDEDEGVLSESILQRSRPDQMEKDKFEKGKASLTPPPGAVFPPPTNIARYSSLKTGRSGPGASGREVSWERKTPSPKKRTIIEEGARSQRMVQFRSAIGKAWKRSENSPSSERDRWSILG